MHVYALDKAFNVVAVGIPYTNLQWHRRYYAAGEFALEVDISTYDASWAYIGTSERPELGMVQKVYQHGEGSVSVLLSGFFCERMLDDKACYPRYVGDASTTEAACRAIFARYKDDIPVALGPANSPMIGDRTRSDFSDDSLGEKLYRILETREASYRVEYDYVGNRLLFGVWKGLDRTQAQSENPFQVFSIEFGNITSRSVNIDDSATKNYAIVPIMAGDDGVETKTLYVDLSGGGYRKETVIPYRSSTPEEGQTQADFEASIVQDVTEQILALQTIVEIDVDVLGDAGYMVDYNLGDVCDVLLTDIGIEMQTRIVEVSEVFKAEGGHSVTVGLGNRRINSVRRVVSSL